MRWRCFFCLPLVSAFADEMEEIYREVNAFRASPVQYCLEKKWGIACDIDISGPRSPLRVIPELEQASGFQASTLASDECLQVSHDTCSTYCYLFGSCDYQMRIGSFMGDVRFDTIREVLIKGVWRPQRILKLLIGSTGHCNDVLDGETTAMGATLIRDAKTVFVLTMVRVIIM